MIIGNVIRSFRNETPPPTPAAPMFASTDFSSGFGTSTISGKVVSAESAKKIATAFRCGNIISDDIAALPFQQYRKADRNREQISPDSVLRNIAYLMEISPNRWMVPFIFKKTIIMWLLYWGDAYIWQPAGAYRELFILPPSRTNPVFDKSGSLWYQTIFPNRKKETIPDVEITHLMINSIDGLVGRSVLTYARETLGGQLGAHETRDRIAGQGLNPSAALYMAGEINDEARKKTKESYVEAMKGSGVAVFDNKVTKFEPVTMKATDAQFLEGIAATDIDICNFFGMPAYKLNMGKQSYEANEQQDIDYLKSTLNPYLVQWEQSARLKWLTQEEQSVNYFRFNREALLQTSAKNRAEYMDKLITSGQMTPNEAREINDMSAYPGGDSHYMPANMASIGEDGTLESATGVMNPPEKKA